MSVTSSGDRTWPAVSIKAVATASIADQFSQNHSLSIDKITPRSRIAVGYHDDGFNSGSGNGYDMPKGKRFPITVGEYEFSTKAEAKQFIQALFVRYQLGQSITGDDDVFVRDLIALHPATHEKVGCGIDHIEIRLDAEYKKNPCFYIIRTDGSGTDVSYIKCVDGESRRRLVRPALRTAILPQIQRFKELQFSRGPLACPYTHEPLAIETCHVDHLPPMTFETVVTQWLKQESLTEDTVQITERQDDQYTRVMTDFAQIASWTAFHQANAHLRILSRRGNLSASKIEAGVAAREQAIQ